MPLTKTKGLDLTGLVLEQERKFMCQKNQSFGESKSIESKRPVFAPIGLLALPEDLTLIPLLAEAVQRLYGYEAIHEETVPVREEFQGKSIWKRNVGIFRLKGHPEAKRCSAWVQRERKTVRYVTVLETGPAISPETAVHSLIALNILENR